MATVVNARDVQLQAASVRLLGVQMQPNIAVDPSNVTGLGLIIEGTKLVWISATSQVIQIPKSGSITPGLITLTANVRNISATPTIALTAGTMSITPTLTSNVFSFTPAQMTSDSITLRVSAVSGATTYTDDMTVIKVREGIDSLSGLITNEAVALPASATGVVSNYGTATGNFKVFQGINDVTSVCTYSIPAGGNPASLTASITPSGAGAGTYTVTGGLADGTDSTTLTLRATFGSATIDKVFAITKSKSGTNGTNGTNGTSGVRGSRTFYVSVAGSTYSDSLATSTASADAGPILNDIVTQYNSGAGFSQTKFWNGTAWTVVNAVVDGSLLVSGTVGASKLTINGGVNSIFPDPYIQDSSIWTAAATGEVLAVRTTISDGVAGVYSWRSTSATRAVQGAAKCRVTVGRTYRVSAKVRMAGANGSLYLRVAYGAPTTDVYSSQQLIGVENVTVTTSWVLYSGTFVATSGMAWVSPVLYLNNAGSTGYMEAQDIRIEELVDDAVVVIGGISADRISATYLSSIVADLGTITAGNITLDSAGFIRGGQTAYNTGTGFFLGYSGGAYKFSMGNATKSLTWDGSELTATALTIKNSAGAVLFGSGTNWDHTLVDGLGGFATLNQITSANVSTYIASAAIARAQIGALNVNTADIVDAAITTAKIGDLQVDSLKIKNASVIVPVASQTLSEISVIGVSEVLLTSGLIVLDSNFNTSINPTAGINVHVTSNIRGESNISHEGSNVVYYLELRLYRKISGTPGFGSLIGRSSLSKSMVDGQPGLVTVSEKSTWFLFDQPGVGSFVYSLVLFQTTSVGLTAQYGKAHSSGLLLQGTKK